MTVPIRHRLPFERNGVSHGFGCGELRGTITANFVDGRLREIFIIVDRPGSTIRGLVDGVAIASSIALQHGVPLEAIARKFIASRFEPAGPTGNRKIPMASSVLDYVFRWLMALEQRQLG